MKFLHGMRLSVGEEVGDDVKIGMIGSLRECCIALGTAGVALLAGEGAVLAEVAEQYSATALFVGKSVFFHCFDALSIFRLSFFIHLGSDDDARGIDTFFCEGDSGAGAARNIMYYSLAT